MLEFRNGQPTQPDPEFRKLYPNLSDEDLIEAQDNFDDYLEVVWKIYQRISSYPLEYKKLKDLLAASKVGRSEKPIPSSGFTQPSLFD